MHNIMHEHYRAQEFDDALSMCHTLQKHFDERMDGYYEMWIERCEFMKTQKLPKDWDGIFVATTK